MLKGVLGVHDRIRNTAGGAARTSLESISGVSMGAAFVFLSAGPATNTVTIGVVKKMLGNRSLYIYLASIIIGSILFGLGLDLIFSANEINPKTIIHVEEQAGILSVGSSVVLWGMLVYFLFFRKGGV